MRKKFFIITAFLLFLLTNIGFNLVFAGPMIEQIQFDSPDANQDLLSFKMNGEYHPKTFALKGERPRLVLDFPDVLPSKKVQNTIQADGTFIKRIRTGIHKGENAKTRIVLDLQEGKELDYSEKFDSQTQTLVLSIYPAGMPPRETMQAEPQPEPVKEETAKAEVAPAREVAQPIKKPAEPAAKTEKPPAQTAGVEQEIDIEAEPTVPLEMLPAEETAETAPAVTPPEPQAVEPQTAKKSGLEESTVIQPLSEIGEKEKTAPGEKTSPTLSAVEFNDSSYRGEIVSFQLNGFYPPVVFGIEEDIPRIVCFFKDTRGAEQLAESIAANGKFIKNIKIGKYRNPNNVRVVLDLVPGKNYDLQQIFFKEDNLFMVIINTTGDKMVN